MFVTLMVVWYLVVDPTVHGGDGALTEALALAYPVGDVILVLGAARVLMRRRSGGEGRAALWLLAGGAMLLAIADVAYARLELSHSYTAGTLPDAIWVLALLAIALAAFSERNPARVEPQYQESDDIAQPVSKLPYLAVLVGLALVLNETSRDVRGPLAVLVLGALGLTVIVVVRQVTVLHDNEHLVHELRRLAHTDSLTGVANRRQLFESSPRIVGAAHRAHESVTVVMIDIDNFKEINDRFGHHAGDQILRAVAEACRSQLRPEDLVGRYGGDELIAVLLDTTTEDALHVAARLQSRLNRFFRDTSVGPVPATLSIGVAGITDTRSLDALLARADIALYTAKREGRNCIRSYA
jgi:diguanylate cyclase (GGDEF)-like protein